MSEGRKGNVVGIRVGGDDMDGRHCERDGFPVGNAENRDEEDYDNRKLDRLGTS